MTARLKSVVPLLIALAVACSGQNSEDSESADQAAARQPDALPAAEGASPGGDKGVGPISSVDLASLDPAAAAEGAEIFNSVCSACHKLDERYIGPALNGVTERRRPEWIMNMILNPDGMVKFDEQAKALLAEYIAPMTNQNLTEDQARAVLTFLLENDKSGGASQDDDEPEAEEAESGE